MLAPVITVGDHALLPDTPGQEVPIYVSGNEQISGVQLFAQVGDGGPELGGTLGPAIADVDMVTGTIFEHDAYVGGDPYLAPQAYVGFVGLETPDTTVTADGLLLTLIIDTTNLHADDDANPWDLKLTDTVDTPTELLIGVLGANATVVPATINNGTITIDNPPTADDQTVTTDEDTPTTITLTGGDIDGDPFSFRVATDPAHGSLSGTAPNLTYTPNDDYDGSDSFTFVTNDGALDSDPATVTITIDPVNDKASVVGRHIFYNNSAFDLDNTAANADDDLAVAPDKTALLPGQTATLANYTSYSSGINGIMVDIDDPDGTPDVGSFEFKVGSDEAPDVWAPAALPEDVTIRVGEGVDGSDRLTIVWADGAVRKQWLQVTVLSTGADLPQDDVFYFGNAVGDSGNSPIDTKVNGFDILGARDNQRTLTKSAPIDFAYDYNRDKNVNAYDMLVARNNQTHFLSDLDLITVAGGEVKKSGAAELDMDVVAKGALGKQEGRSESSGTLAWLHEVEPAITKDQPSDSDDLAAAAVDALLAAYRS